MTSVLSGVTPLSLSERVQLIAQRNPQYDSQRLRLLGEAWEQTAHAYALHAFRLTRVPTGKRDLEQFTVLYKDIKVRLVDAFMLLRRDPTNMSNIVGAGMLLDAANERDGEPVYRQPDDRLPLDVQVVDAELIQEALEDALSQDQLYAVSQPEVPLINRAGLLNSRIEYVRPFPQANRRLANLVGMAMLFQAGFPAPAITCEDRRNYFSILNPTLSLDELGSSHARNPTTADLAMVKLYETRVNSQLAAIGTRH